MSQYLEFLQYMYLLQQYNYPLSFRLYINRVTVSDCCVTKLQQLCWPLYMCMQNTTNTEVCAFYGFIPKECGLINPIALRKAKIVCNFGLSECNRVKHGWTMTVNILSGVNSLFKDALIKYISCTSK